MTSRSKIPATFREAEARLFGRRPPGHERFLEERIFHSACRPLRGDRLTLYRPAELRRIRDAGFNAVWLWPPPLRDLVQTRVFPGLGRHQEANQQGLRRILDDCAKLNMGLYLYFLEPAFLYADDPFWTTHSDVRGDNPCLDVHPSITIPRHEICLCSSTPQVQEFLRSGYTELARALPGLRGTIHITATEQLSHCWSHAWNRVLEDCRCFWPFRRRPNCPRCAGRTPEAVIGEILRLVRDGLHSVDPAMRVVAWNWDWTIYYPDPQPRIIRALPDGITFMSDFERGGWKESFGKRYLVDEYALSYIGPSPKYTRSTELARRRGFDVFAKLQLGAAHDFGALPNLPLICNVQQKMVGLYRSGARGTMASWDFGCTPGTLNTYVFKRFCDDPERGLDQERFLEAIAREYFGDVDGHHLLQGWRLFCLAFDLFPFSQRFTYASPINNAPAYPVLPDYLATPGRGYYAQGFSDRLDETLIRFSCREVVDRFEQMERLWRDGLRLCECELRKPGGDTRQRRHRRDELSVARIVPIHLRGVANAYRMHQWKLDQTGGPLGTTPRRFTPDAIARAIMRDEIANARRAITLWRADHRLGYHVEAGRHLYTDRMILDKIARMKEYL